MNSLEKSMDKAAHDYVSHCRKCCLRDNQLPEWVNYKGELGGYYNNLRDEDMELFLNEFIRTMKYPNLIINTTDDIFIGQYEAISIQHIITGLQRDLANTNIKVYGQYYDSIEISNICWKRTTGCFEQSGIYSLRFKRHLLY